MNRNFLIGFAVTVAVLALIVFILSRFLEIYPTTEFSDPSREARINNYLALDRWLESMGHPVRVVQSGDLALVSQAGEKRIFMQSSLFQWTDDAVEYLVRWVEEGGHLFLVQDNFRGWDDELPSPLLEKVEIGIKRESSSYYFDPESPNYDASISFEFPEGEGALLLKDRNGIVKLVQLQLGKGKLTVTGRPFFLQNWRIGDAPNARLAWALLASDSAAQAAPGWLFIRGATRVSGLVGSLFRHGNFAVLIVSALVLLVVGFWAVIPRFGLVRGDDERPGKPLRERFLAEGRFLKRYDALGSYRDIYVREIKRRLARKEGLRTNDEIIRYFQGDRGLGIEDRDQLFARALRREPFTYREFPKMIIILMNILERIK